MACAVAALVATAELATSRAASMGLQFVCATETGSAKTARTRRCTCAATSPRQTPRARPRAAIKHITVISSFLHGCRNLRHTRVFPSARQPRRFCRSSRAHEGWVSHGAGSALPSARLCCRARHLLSAGPGPGLTLPAVNEASGAIWHPCPIVPGPWCERSSCAHASRLAAAVLEPQGAVPAPSSLAAIFIPNMHCYICMRIRGVSWLHYSSRRMRVWLISGAKGGQTVGIMTSAFKVQQQEEHNM